MTDQDVARAAWQDFRPAVPATMHGVGFGVAGFLAGLVVFGALRTLLHRMVSRRSLHT